MQTYLSIHLFFITRTMYCFAEKWWMNEWMNDLMCAVLPLYNNLSHVFFFKKKFPIYAKTPSLCNKLSFFFFLLLVLFFPVYVLSFFLLIKFSFVLSRSFPSALVPTQEWIFASDKRHQQAMSYVYIHSTLCLAWVFFDTSITSIAMG